MSLINTLLREPLGPLDFLLMTIQNDYWGNQFEPFLFTFFLGILALFVGVKRIRLSKINFFSFLFFIQAIVMCFVLQGASVSDKVYLLICFFLFFFLIQSVAFQEKHISTGFICLFGLTLIQAVYALLQWAGLLKSGNTFFPVTGSFINPALLGIFLSIGFLISMFMLYVWFSKPYLRYAFVFSSLGIFISLLLSYSRAAYLSGFLSLSFLFYQVFKKEVRELYVGYRYYFIPAGVLFLLMVSYAFAYGNVDSISGRLLIWKISFSMFLDHPLLGIGFGNYAVMYGKYQAAYFVAHGFPAREIQLAGVTNYAFNEPLELLIENGIFGFFLFSLMLACSFRNLYNAGKKNILFFLAFSVLLNILLFSLFSYPFHEIGIFLVFWSMIAIGSVSGMDQEYLLSRFLKFILLIPLLLLIHRSVQKLSAIGKWKSGYERLLYSEQDSKEDYRETFTVLNNNPGFLYNYASALYDYGEYAESIKMADLAEKYLDNIDLHLIRGDSYLALKQFDQAEKEYTFAHQMQPSLFAPLDRLFELLLQNGDTSTARQIAKKIIAMPVKVASSEVRRIKLKSQHFLNIKTTTELFKSPK